MMSEGPARLRLRGSEQGYAELVAPTSAGQVEVVLPDTPGTLATEEYVAQAATGGALPYIANSQVISEDLTIEAASAVSAGPVEIADGVTVTLVAAEDSVTGLPSSWTIL